MLPYTPLLRLPHSLTAVSFAMPLTPSHRLGSVPASGFKPSVAASGNDADTDAAAAMLAGSLASALSPAGLVAVDAGRAQALTLAHRWFAETKEGGEDMFR